MHKFSLKPFCWMEFQAAFMNRTAWRLPTRVHNPRNAKFATVVNPKSINLVKVSNCQSFRRGKSYERKKISRATPMLSYKCVTHAEPTINMDHQKGIHMREIVVSQSIRTECDPVQIGKIHNSDWDICKNCVTANRDLFLAIKLATIYTSVMYRNSCHC